MRGTGGGPALKISLTDLELRVMAIIGEQAATGMQDVPEVGFAQVSFNILQNYFTTLIKTLLCPFFKYKLNLTFMIKQMMLIYVFVDTE